MLGYAHHGDHKMSRCLNLKSLSLPASIVCPEQYLSLSDQKAPTVRKVFNMYVLVTCMCINIRLEIMHNRVEVYETEGFRSSLNTNNILGKLAFRNKITNEWELDWKLRLRTMYCTIEWQLKVE